MNLYSYVENGPINRVDADGHSYAGFDGFMAPRGNEVDQYNVSHGAYGVDADYDSTTNLETGQTTVDRPQQQATAKLGIGIEVPSRSAVSNNTLDVSKDPGHTFVYVRDASGTISSILSFGPSEGIGGSNAKQFLGGNLPGDAHWPISGTVKTWEIPISTKQANAAMKAIADFKGNPPNYTPSMQCTSAALSIAAKAGVSLPSGVGPVIATKTVFGVTATVWSGNVANPYHLNQQMNSTHGTATEVNGSRFPAP